MVNGLIKEGLSLFGWVAGFMAANAYGESLARMLPQSLSDKTARLIVAYVLLFVGVILLVMLLRKSLEGLIKAGGLSPVDRILGAIFGFVRGVVIVLVVVLLCGMTAVPQQPFWKKALLSPLAETGVRMIKPFLPYSFARQINF